MNTKKPIFINYAFFGIFLVIELIIDTLNVLTIQNTPLYSKAFFLIYAYGQSILEISIFILLAALFNKFFKKFIFHSFIAVSFIFFIVHIIDYAIFKIMDMNFWEALDLVLDENLENFIEMLHATSIPFFIWIILGILSLFLPLIGIFLYKICNVISIKRKIIFYDEHFMHIFFCIPLGIFLWDFNASATINPNIYAEYTRALPWKLTFVQPKILTVDFPVELKKPKTEKEMLSTLDKKDLKAEKKPNIFIFVIESLRNDFITDEIAPALYKFKQENISFERSLSNSNATPLSWFSLFYSNFSYFWKYYKDKNWQSGATGLYILKKIGYDINVFSAPELKYYSMKDLLFGKNSNLANSFNLFPHYHPKEACDSDIEAILEMEKNIKTDKNVYITFFDSTHFLYSWPKDFNVKFTPYIDVENLNIYPSRENIELFKNRYKNSINFIDSLLNSFFEKLKKQNLWDDAIIVIVGDHGEEFFEEGHLFHASHLSAVQTNIPIYLKLGKNIRKVPQRKIISQMDVFPSILDYIFEKNIFGDLLYGDSIFNENTFPFVITTRFNGSRSPYEFFIHTENEKLTLKFKKKKDIFKNQHIQIMSYKDKNDNAITISSKQKIIRKFEKAINKIFNR
jgi:hypothetical protein